jgi:hypothetical protein
MREIVIKVEGIPILVGINEDGSIDSMRFETGADVADYFTPDAVKFVEKFVATWLADEEQEAKLERGENAAEYKNRPRVRM